MFICSFSIIVLGGVLLFVKDALVIGFGKIQGRYGSCICVVNGGLASA
jgi:hypothetical protein